MRRRKQESGTALLMVFLIAAIIAISLYMEIPRVAFESQRQKEQLLMERGAQYKRAIQMFLAANKRWPATIEELENFNNRRYLRKRFVDPMTGKKEWRFIHINNGILIDSLVQKPKGPQAAASSQSQLVAEIPISTADTTNGGQPGVNPAMRRRASDGMMPGVGGNGSGQPADPNNPNDPNNPQNPGYPGQPYPGMPGQPGQTYPGMAVQPGQYPPGVLPPPGVPVMPGQPGAYGQNTQYPGQPQYPGQTQYPGQPTPYPGQAVQYPGQPAQYPGQAAQYPGQSQFPGGLPGMPVNSQGGGGSYPYPTNQGANGNPPGFPPGALNPQQQLGANPASQMIQQILTSPRPGGMPTGITGTTVGAGIAGVATNADAEGIMVYNDHTNYKEWEFIFDPSKVKPVPNPLTGALGTSAAQMGSMPGQMPGQPGQPGTPAPPVDPFAVGQTTNSRPATGQ